MLKNIRVAWSIFGSEPPFTLIVGGLESELPSWGQCEESMLDAVNIISARYFADAVWERLFGLDLVEAEMLFQIESPTAMAGSYEVTLRRVTTAQCKRISDPRVPHGCVTQRTGSLALAARA